MYHVFSCACVGMIYLRIFLRPLFDYMLNINTTGRIQMRFKVYFIKWKKLISEGRKAQTQGIRVENVQMCHCREYFQTGQAWAIIVKDAIVLA